MNRRKTVTYAGLPTQGAPHIEFKALADEGDATGRFEAIVSVFGNVDFQGDRVIKGAFSKSLQRWKKSGDPIPIIWSHNWGDPNAHIGWADPALAEETEKGLKLIGQFDIDKPFARQVYDLVKSRRVKEWSFAYDIEDEKQADDKANELITLDIIEAGPTLKGANPDTMTLGVKSELEAAARAERAGPKVGTATIKIKLDTSDFEKQLGEIEARMAKLGLSTESVPKTEKNVYTYLDGSSEAAAEEMREAVRAWAETNVPKTGEYGPYVYPVGTFADHVIVEIDDPTEERRYVRLSYTRDADGTITFGAAQDVELNVSVTAAEKEWLEAEFKFHVETKDFDDSEWDGSAAMATCDSAADFRSIAFERDNDSDSDTAAHWALPHHKSPGALPNANGVSAALGALNGARGGKPDLKNENAARTHLEAHGSAIENERGAASDGAGKGKTEAANIRARLRAITEG